tara:strand:- start:387 stop:1214 length:828 start_codon:yes stop_codon:yes gene_type:complete
VKLNQVIFIAFFVFVGGFALDAHGQLVFEETFDTPSDAGLYARLKHHKYLDVVPDLGTDHSPVLKATYKSSKIGSERIVVRYPLNERGMEYTLLFDVKFDKEFQFVKGGKMHGLGPDRPITGGNPMKPTGWSARMMFHKNDEIQTYLYCQNKTGKYGRTLKNPNFKFEKNKFYAISYHVRVNDNGKQNGFAHIYIDGKPIIQHNEIEYRASDDPSTLISQFMFSTFHGGHSPSNAPRDEDGNYKDVYAYYDNLAVWKGQFVKDKPGPIGPTQASQ